MTVSVFHFNYGYNLNPNLVMYKSVTGKENFKKASDVFNIDIVLKILYNNYMFGKQNVKYNKFCFECFFILIIINFINFYSGLMKL